MANRVGAEKQRLQDERNAKIAQFGEALDKRNSNIANTAANAVVASTAQDAMDSVATQSQEQTDRIMQALAYNRELDFNDLEAAQSAKRADQTLARIEAVNAQSAALQNHANDMQQHFNARVKYGQQSAQQAFRDGQERGYFNAHQGYKLQKASFTGFDGIMTDADRWGAISTQTRRWGQEDTSTILAGMAAVTFAPMMAADLLAVGALAARGGMALGRFSLEGVNNMGRMMYSQYQAHGARGMLLNAGYSTNGLSLEVAKYASLKSAQRTAGYVMRNPLATLQAGFSATGRALTPMLRNENVQAGLINGFVNTSYEAFINGNTDMLDLGKTFAATSVGGYFGSRVSNSAAFSSMSTLNREVMAGFIGNASSEALTQFGNYMLSDDDYTFNGTKVLTSGLLGAGFGGGLVNLGLTKPPVFIFSDAVRDPIVKGLAASYGVSFSFTELTK
uniref:Uncharacterized protein n=1 Tax=Rheinheimera sp. BAL341 TaxID=1708203 RepID=A0A486XW19_9GAMM